MSHAPEPHCLNCGAELQGAWCHACGQKATSKHLAMHDVAHDTVHEFLHLDGKILNTMKLLVFRPGELTREFVEGRRVRYITPLRLYLTWSVLFFALTALVPAARRAVITVKTTEATVAAAEAEADRLGEAVMHSLPRAMFVLMPFFALLTWALYRKQQPFYIPHLYYSVHFHAFVFFLLTLTVLCTILGRYGKMVGSVLFIAIFPYHFLGLRRFFASSPAMTFVKGTVAGVVYLFVTGGVMAVIVYWSLKH